MIPPNLIWLWRQFNGPQITGITKGIFEFMQRKFDPKLDYFNNFKISTARSEHLDLIGIIQGISRPILSMTFYVSRLFRFDGKRSLPTDMGFAETETQSDGVGLFDASGGITDPGSSYLDTPLWRTFLQLTAKHKGYDYGLAFVDELIKAFSFYGQIVNWEYTWEGFPGDFTVRFEQPSVFVQDAISKCLAGIFDTMPQIQVYTPPEPYPKFQVSGFIDNLFVGEESDISVNVYNPQGYTINVSYKFEIAGVDDLEALNAEIYDMEAEAFVPLALNEFLYLPDGVQFMTETIIFRLTPAASLYNLPIGFQLNAYLIQDGELDTETVLATSGTLVTTVTLPPEA
jgi:hypothetical protein